MRESTETHSTHSRHLGQVRFYVSEVIRKGKRRMRERERERREENLIFPSLTSGQIFFWEEGDTYNLLKGRCVKD